MFNLTHVSTDKRNAENLTQKMQIYIFRGHLLIVDYMLYTFPCSPVKQRVVTNDRWGIDTMCKHGGVLTCTDRYNPGNVCSGEQISFNSLSVCIFCLSDFRGIS